MTCCRLAAARQRRSGAVLSALFSALFDLPEPLLAIVLFGVSASFRWSFLLEAFILSFDIADSLFVMRGPGIITAGAFALAFAFAFAFTLSFAFALAIGTCIVLGSKAVSDIGWVLFCCLFDLYPASVSAVVDNKSRSFAFIQLDRAANMGRVFLGTVPASVMLSTPVRRVVFVVSKHAVMLLFIVCAVATLKTPSYTPRPVAASTDVASLVPWWVEPRLWCGEFVSTFWWWVGLNASTCCRAAIMSPLAFHGKVVKVFFLLCVVLP